MMDHLFGQNEYRALSYHPIFMGILFFKYLADGYRRKSVDKES